MLTPLDETVETTAPSPDKTILSQYYGSANGLMYTVPTGRKFTGYLWGHSSIEQFIVLSGGTLNNSSNAVSSTQSMWPPYSENYTNGTPQLTLRAGDAIYSGSSSNYRARLVGVESDA
tara:strand:- start:5918 stop:6271 length:354 start_codon:yes stop_codon:yes gene_type:complete